MPSFYHIRCIKHVARARSHTQHVSACRQEPLQTLTLFAVAGELHSYSEVCEALSTLEVALGFLAMTGGEPQMQMSRYLEEVLQMENQMAPHILKVSLSETPATLSRLLVLHFLCMPTLSSFVIWLVLSGVLDLKNKVLIGVRLFVFFLCVENFMFSLLLPTDPEHVLSEALRGPLAAAGLTQIRKHAAAQEGKASAIATRTQLSFKLVLQMPQ